MIAVLAGLLTLDAYLEHLSRDHEASETIATALVALPTAAVLAILVILAFGELTRLAKACGVGLLGISGRLATIGLATHPYWNRFLGGALAGSSQWGSLLVLALLAIFAEQMLRYRTADALRRVAATLLAVTYLGVCGSLIFVIRFHGVSILVLFLAAVKFTDIGAYFTGTALGRHKMIPWLSPGKSWEGLLGGLTLGILVALVLGWALNVDSLRPWQIALFAALVALAGQFGDLCESLLKRSAQAKDSGAVVPEFGGVLDIIDSPLLAAPVAVICLAWLGS